MQELAEASRRSTVAHEVATDLLQRLLQQGTGPPAGTEQADMIDVSAVADVEPPETLQLRFKHLDFDEAVAVARLTELQDLGLPAIHASKLHIRVSKGSIVADISGPLHSMRALKSLPLILGESGNSSLYVFFLPC
eukprot:s4187_g4.t1